jgi:hypothetical protein
MTNARDHLGFALKACRLNLGVKSSGAQNFDGDGATQISVFREKDDAHSSLAEFLEQPIPTQLRTLTDGCRGFLRWFRFDLGMGHDAAHTFYLAFCHPGWMKRGRYAFSEWNGNV